MERKLFTIKMYDERGQQIEFAQSYWNGSYADLEETLYILYEIEPKGRYWRNAMDATNGTTFTYHHLADSFVYVDYSNNEIKIMDLNIA